MPELYIYGLGCFWPSSIQLGMINHNSHFLFPSTVCIWQYIYNAFTHSSPCSKAPNITFKDGHGIFISKIITGLFGWRFKYCSTSRSSLFYTHLFTHACLVLQSNSAKWQKVTTYWLASLWCQLPLSCWSSFFFLSFFSCFCFFFFLFLNEDGSDWKHYMLWVIFSESAFKKSAALSACSFTWRQNRHYSVGTNWKNSFNLSWSKSHKLVATG